MMQPSGRQVGAPPERSDLSNMASVLQEGLRDLGSGVEALVKQQQETRDVKGTVRGLGAEEQGVLHLMAGGPKSRKAALLAHKQDGIGAGRPLRWGKDERLRPRRTT